MRGFFDDLFCRLIQVPRGVASGDPSCLTFPALATNGGDHWRVRDACEGTQVFGMTGAGKTLSNAFLSTQFSGLVLCANVLPRNSTGISRRFLLRDSDDPLRYGSFS